MTKAVSLDLQRVPKRFLKARIIAVVLFLVVALVAMSTSSSSLEHDKATKKTIRALDSFWGDPPLSGNPGPSSSVCAASFDVIYIVDRSSSISAGEAAQLRAALKAEMWALAARGQALNVAINVYISVFASSTKNKTPWGWSGVWDVTTPQGLTDHLNLIDAIPFWSEGGLGRFDYLAPLAGVAHATNWHDAFVDTAQTIGFWNNHAVAPVLTPDKDFDLVVMVTDGEPTINNGPNEVYDRGVVDDQTSGSTTGADDKKSSRYLVNALRTGGPVNNNWYMGSPVYVNRSPFPALDLSARQPVNVVGIIIDTNNNKAAMAGNMSYIFGAENVGWFYSNNFNSSLNTAITSSSSSLTCTAAKTGVTSGISATISASPTTVLEGHSTSITISVTNTGTIDLSSVKVSGAGCSPPRVIASLPAGVTKTFTAPCIVNVPFGGPDPQDETYTVTSTSLFDSSTMELTSGVLNPTASPVASIDVERVPLPS